MMFRTRQISLLISSLFIAGVLPAFADDAKPATTTDAQAATTDVGQINVQGQPGGTDSGLIQQEETPKARSSVNKSYMDKQSATASPFQQIALLPGVSVMDYDGTGLFGGNIRVRGFNSDELGFTIDGAPVNDSGNFAVYPQEYTDPENLCEIFVTQGSTDTDAPHVGASGGNIGLVTCDPEDLRRVRVSSTFGSDNLWKAFVRFDTGKVLNGTTKIFISYSKAEADKFKGEGEARKEHIDFKSVTDFGGGSSLKMSVLHNWELNNNYLAPTKAQINQYGWDVDYGTTPPVHQPDPAPKGSTVNDTTYAPNVAANIPTLGYYGLSLNPFKNNLITAQLHLVESASTSFDIDPYFWYGYGTGGNELQSQQEQVGSKYLGGGYANFNGNNDTTDKVYLYEGSVTETYRPGVTMKSNFTLDNQRIVAGLWFERARQFQTAPYVRIDNNGNAANVWENDPSQWILTQNGFPLEYRDFLTINTGHSVFVQDNIGLMQDKLNLQLGLKDAGISREFFNYPNQTNGGYYSLNDSYNELLPNIGLRYQLSQDQSIFFNGARNFKAPPNNAQYSGVESGGTYSNGVLTGYTVTDPHVKAETSNNFDLGYRIAGERLTLSGSLFYIDFQNRISQSYDPATQTYDYENVGNSTSKGIELESAYKVTQGLTAYGSVSYLKSKIDDNTASNYTLPNSKTIAYLPTAGKEFPDTPNWLAGASLQYTQDNWYVFGQAKYTGKRYTTLVNDDWIGGFAVVNMGAGIKFQDYSMLKHPTLKLNVGNVFDRKYLSLSSASGSYYTTNAIALPGISAKSPVFYVSAPTAFSVNLSADF